MAGYLIIIAWIPLSAERSNMITNRITSEFHNNKLRNIIEIRLRLNSKISESLVNIVLAESDSKVDPDISTDPSVPVRRMFFVDFSNQLNNG